MEISACVDFLEIWDRINNLKLIVWNFGSLQIWYLENRSGENFSGFPENQDLEKQSNKKFAESYWKTI
jgi:hypothetical protein